MTSILLADDHTLVAAGLAALLKDHFTLLGVVHDGRALLEAADRLRPNVILTDISMPLLNGLDAIRQIHKMLPLAKIIVLTVHADSSLAVKTFQAGAAGYLLKTVAPEELINAVREVAAGRSYITPQIAKDFLDVVLQTSQEDSQAGKLTARQREVLQLLAEGYTMKEVARILKISQRTVETHKYEMMHLLGAETTAALIQLAVRLKLIPE